MKDPGSKSVNCIMVGLHCEVSVPLWACGWCLWPFPVHSHEIYVLLMGAPLAAAVQFVTKM